MAYGLRYIREYTNVQDATCRLEFWQKDYIGASQYILGSRDSFILAKEIDDPFEPIQAQPATIELLTDEQTGFGIEEFYSEDDEEWMIKFYLVPFGGIQKSLFYTAIVSSIILSHTDTDNTITIFDSNPSPGIKAGQTIVIKADTYTITKVEYGTGNYTLHVAETVQSRAFFETDITVYDILDDGLIYTGFILQDESEDAFISYDHFIKLTATDNLGLLSDISFDVACGDLYPYGHFTILEYLQIILAQTGLSLPVQIYANLYETRNVSRADDPAATFADQIRIYSGAFADEDGKWQSCYDILSSLLKTFGCILTQRKGKWVIYRWGELRDLNNQPFPGTEFSADGSDKSAVELPNQPVLISDKRNVLTGGADNKSYLVRPYKYVNYTYNYKQPAQLLRNENLQELGDKKGTSHSSDGKLLYEDYNFPPFFRHETGNSTGTTPDSSFIRVVTEVATETETDRFIYTPFTTHDYKWLSFAPIEVSKGDVLDFSCQFKALSDSSNPLRIFIRFALFFIDNNGNTVLWELSPFHLTDTSYGKYSWVFEGNVGAQNYKTFLGVPIDVIDNITDWQSFSLSGTTVQNWVFPPFPQDGILVVSLDGANNTATGSSLAYVDIATKDIQLKIKNKINESYDVSGQTHTQTQTGVIKNNKEESITIDDSPRLPIAGTLLLDKLRHYNYYDYDAYMDNTQYWLQETGEKKRLGQITTFDLKQVFGQLRMKLDCSFVFDDYIDVLTTFQIQVLAGLNFRFGSVSSINFFDCTCHAQLIECWKSGEYNGSYDYQFKYLYTKS
jgi:hypothetical protein